MEKPIRLNAEDEEETRKQMPSISKVGVDKITFENAF